MAESDQGTFRDIEGQTFLWELSKTQCRGLSVAMDSSFGIRRKEEIKKTDAREDIFS